MKIITFSKVYKKNKSNILRFNQMKTLKILVPYATGHETTSIRTLLFNNMIPILKKRVNVKIQRIL